MSGETRKEMTFKQLQTEVNEWARENFGPHEPPYHRCLLGAAEEIGEACRAHLKGEQGIRGTARQHAEDGKDAVADTIIYLADYCCARGWDLQEIIEQTWDRVSQRNWRANPYTGEATDG